MVKALYIEFVIYSDTSVEWSTLFNQPHNKIIIGIIRNADQEVCEQKVRGVLFSQSHVSIQFNPRECSFIIGHLRLLCIAILNITEGLRVQVLYVQTSINECNTG